MTDAKPIDGSTPYEKLGVDRTDTKKEIIGKAEALEKQKKIKLRQISGSSGAKSSEYNETYQEYKEIQSAKKEIEQNHPKDGYAPPVDLSLNVLTDDPEVRSPVEFKVTAEGSPEPDVTVLVKNSGQSVKTKRDGTESLEFDKKGSVELKAQKSGSDRIYNPDTAQFTVSPRSVSLSIDQAPDSLEVGEAGELKVTDQDGIPLRGVELEHAGDVLDTTNNEGAGTVRFQELGPKQVTARAADNDSITFSNAQTDITVTQREVELNLTKKQNSIKVGEEVILEVLDQNDREVSGVKIEADNGPSGITDENGKVPLSFSEAREYTLRLTKNVDKPEIKYNETKVPIIVGPGEAVLELNDTEGDFVEGAEVSIQITTQTERPVQGVDITTSHGQTTQTDADGWADIRLENSDNIQIQANKSSDRFDYQKLEKTLVVNEVQPEIYLKGVPNFASPGDQIDVEVVNQHDSGIENARIVSSKQQREWLTNSEGLATIQVSDQPGPESFTADKMHQNYENGPAEKRIVVRP